MNATVTNPAADSSTPAKGNKGKTNSGKAEKGTKPKRIVVLGAEGVAQIEAHAVKLQSSLGFKPTHAQVVSLLLSKAAAAEAAQE